MDSSPGSRHPGSDEYAPREADDFKSPAFRVLRSLPLVRSVWAAWGLFGLGLGHWVFPLYFRKECAREAACLPQSYCLSAQVSYGQSPCGTHTHTHTVSLVPPSLDLSQSLHSDAVPAASSVWTNFPMRDNSAAGRGFQLDYILTGVQQARLAEDVIQASLPTNTGFRQAGRKSYFRPTSGGSSGFGPSRRNEDDQCVTLVKGSL